MLAGIKGAGTKLWGDVFALSTAFEKLYDCRLRWRFETPRVGEYAGVVTIVLEAASEPKGYTTDLYADTRRVYTVGEGVYLDVAMYECLCAFEEMLRAVNDYEVGPLE